MKIAIVGGGAAGMVSAYLLSGHHALTVFEADDVLGGNVRTLGGNVRCDALEDGLALDAGVIEFDELKFRALSKLLDELKIERVEAPGTTAMYLRDGRCFRSRGNIRLGVRGGGARLAAFTRLLGLLPAQRRFQRRLRAAASCAATKVELYGRSMGDFLDDGVHGTWLRMLLMYAYSIDYRFTDDIPAALGVPTLAAFTGDNRWTAIRGGSYSYIQRIVESMEAEIRLRTPVAGLSRTSGGVEVTLATGEIARFDAVVIATTPERVLELLRDPSPEERRRFAGWEAHTARTVVHRDTGPYERRGLEYYSEFDLFETEEGAGYNVYLNRLAGLPRDHPSHYFLAFELDSEIDPALILHVQHHRTPSYSTIAVRHREEVIRTNGENETFYAGAWLGDGLHEGAVQSAVRVSERLGGRTL